MSKVAYLDAGESTGDGTWPTLGSEMTPAAGDVVRIEVDPLVEIRLLINGIERAAPTQYTTSTSFCGFRFGPYYERPFSGDFWWDDLTAGFMV